LAAASQGLAAYNYGGVLGVICLASLVNRLGSRILTLTASLLAALTAFLLMTSPINSSANPLPLLAAHGFGVNALQTNLFALGVYLYPTRVRARGVAVASAMTRVGGIISALTGPWIIQLGQGRFFEYLTVAMLMAFVGMTLLRNHIPRVSANAVEL
jgi:AAHS family 4-hydroxybenzoate transporter-like MFS transporter